MSDPPPLPGEGQPSSTTADERAAMRAFVQRCEVRLSTLHRVASALLSGAGLLVVLPVVARDAVSGILRSLVVGGMSGLDVVLMVAVLAVLAVPGVAVWMLFADLTRFYFHANHLGQGGAEVFTPRFTLTALRLPADELGPQAGDALTAARHDDRIVELLVPVNESARRRIDRQLHVYHDLGHQPARTDLQRAEGLFELAAAAVRPLSEEVAKVEYGMARHALRLRGLVLRYVKALLALLTSAVAVYAGDAVVVGLSDQRGLPPAGQMWLAAIVLVWAPLAVLAIFSPVRWIEQQMRRDGAPAAAVSDDPELTMVERATIRIAAVGWVAAVAAMVLAAVRGEVLGGGRAAGLAVLAASAVAVAVVARSGRFHNLLRLNGG